MEYLSTYGWAFMLLIIGIAILYQLGIFSIGTYMPSSADVVGFNSFNINRFLLHANGSMELDIVNLLEDVVTVKEISENDAPASSSSPPLPFNLTGGANVSVRFSTALSGAGGGLYNAKVSIKFDVNRGTADHFDSGFLRGSYQP